MKTAELTFVIFFFFWIPLSLLLGHHHLETGDLLHLLKTLAAHLMSLGPQPGSLPQFPREIGKQLMIQATLD